MNRVGAGAAGDVEDALGDQIALRRGAGPIGQASSQARTCGASRSASENTAIVRRPMARAVRAIRTAISPRLAISRLENIGSSPRISGR